MFWKDNQPVASFTREKHDCVKMDTSGKWDDIGCCRRPIKYACQKPTALVFIKVFI